MSERGRLAFGWFSAVAAIAVVAVLVSVGASKDELVLAFAIVAMAFVVGASVASSVRSHGADRNDRTHAHRPIMLVSAAAMVLGFVLLWVLTIAT